MPNCQSIPHYTPVAAFINNVYIPGTSGIFAGCLTNGEQGFQVNKAIILIIKKSFDNINKKDVDDDFEEVGGCDSGNDYDDDDDDDNAIMVMMIMMATTIIDNDDHHQKNKLNNNNNYYYYHHYYYYYCIIVWGPFCLKCVTVKSYT
jgi:hypothetical protein